MNSKRVRLSATDSLAIVISLATLLATAIIGWKVFEHLPHIEDEIAYVWQAKIIARGDLTLPSPNCPRCFLVPFVVDYNGLRFGKYPIGWPVLLSFAVSLGKRAWLPPILAGANIWLLYRLCKKIVDSKTALLAAFLTASSPFFLMNASSLLAHNWGLFLALAFILGWFDSVFDTPNLLPAWLPPMVSALSLGALALTRPLTAIGVAIPFFIHGLIIVCGKNTAMRKKIMAIALGAGLTASLHFAWQYAVTGNPFLNPYELWWPYDKIGFGAGIGLQETGFSLYDAYANTDFSLWVGSHDLFGWPYLSYIMLPLGIWSLLGNKKAWLAGLVFPSLVFCYAFYWIGAWLLGPRYYFEGMVSLALLSAAGIRYAAGKISGPLTISTPSWWKNIRLTGTMLISALLISANLFIYLPVRLGGLYGLYGHRQSRLEPFLTLQARELAPALVIVHAVNDWGEYGTLLELSSPYNDSPFIFTYNRGEELNRQIENQFPERSVYHYYPDEPYKFYTAPRPSRIF